MGAILRCYEVTAITERDGIIEYLNGFVSLHELKKHIQSQGFDLLGVRLSLGAHLQEYIRYSFEGKPHAFQRFRRNFIYSLAAFSNVCYVLQIKDRNDGNVGGVVRASLRRSSWTSTAFWSTSTSDSCSRTVRATSASRRRRSSSRPTWFCFVWAVSVDGPRRRAWEQRVPPVPVRVRRGRACR